MACALAGMQAVAFAVVVVSRPEWHDLDPATPWLVWWPSWSLFRAFTLAYQVGGAALAVAVLAAIVARFRPLRGFDRGAMRPVVSAVVLAAGLTAVADAGTAGLLSGPAQQLVYLVQTAALVGIPLAFLTAAVRRWFALDGLPDLAGRLREARTGRQVETELRVALKDPALILVYRDDEPGPDDWVDVDGRASTAGRDGRHVVELVGTRGDVLGLVLGDPALRRYATLVDPIVRTAARVVENTRLQTLVLARIAETRRSTARLSALLAIERQRLDDDLRAGPLRPVEAARARLAGLPDAELDDLRGRLEATARDLTGLAAGKPPDGLVDHGLAGALTALAGGPVTVVVPPDRFPPEVETAAYFAAAELVTNAVKHAVADHIRVDARVAEGVLTIRVRDDGCGGADVHGSGLTGVRDRVGGVGGELDVHSPTGGGTVVRARIPLDGGRGSSILPGETWHRWLTDCRAGSRSTRSPLRSRLSRIEGDRHDHEADPVPELP